MTIKITALSYPKRHNRFKIQAIPNTINIARIHTVTIHDDDNVLPFFLYFFVKNFGRKPPLKENNRITTIETKYSLEGKQ